MWSRALDTADKLASVAGAAIGVVTLAIAVVELRRIRKELTQRPDIRIGVTDCVIVRGKVVRDPIRRTKLHVVFRDKSALSDKVTIQCFMRNVGQRSARDLLLNIIPEAGITILPPDKGQELTLLCPPGGIPYLGLKEGHLHPMDHRSLDFAVRIPRNRDSFHCKLTISRLDAEDVVADLEFNIISTEAPLVQPGGQ